MHSLSEMALAFQSSISYAAASAAVHQACCLSPNVAAGNVCCSFIASLAEIAPLDCIM